MSCGSKHKYGNASQVKTHFADGGQVKKWPAPKKGGKPKKVTTKNPPGGPRTPGAKAEKYADGGMVQPKKGGTPKKITTKNPPGGPHTPGAKKGKGKG